MYYKKYPRKTFIYSWKFYNQHIFTDDINDGITSAFNNGSAKNDEWSRDQKGNGTNAPKHERTKPGKPNFNFVC